MVVEYSGWDNNKGNFTETYLVSENGDLEIRFRNGSVFKQVEPFENRTHDWNYDGDVYTLYACVLQDSCGAREYMTPYDLVGLIIDEEATVNGIKKL